MTVAPTTTHHVLEVSALLAALAEDQTAATHILSQMDRQRLYAFGTACLVLKELTSDARQHLTTPTQ